MTRSSAVCASRVRQRRRRRGCVDRFRPDRRMSTLARASRIRISHPGGRSARNVPARGGARPRDPSVSAARAVRSRGFKRSARTDVENRLAGHEAHPSANERPHAQDHKPVGIGCERAAMHQSLDRTTPYYVNAISGKRFPPFSNSCACCRDATFRARHRWYFACEIRKPTRGVARDDWTRDAGLGTLGLFYRIDLGTRRIECGLYILPEPGTEHPRRNNLEARGPEQGRACLDRCVSRSRCAPQRSA
jgi:hypothetical protein